VLAEEGHEVTVERRGDEGLARAVREVFNLVITDLRLPGLSGMELVRQLHAAQPRLPIILTTAFGTTEIAIEATKFGAYDYLLKPFDMPRLIELVRKASKATA
jgi:DNA-binding NtrC family response regulator